MTTSILPQYPSYNFIPILALVGWLSLIGLLAFVVLIVYLLLKPRGEKAGKLDTESRDKIIRDIWLFLSYSVVFFGCWVMMGSIAWLLGVVYLTVFLKVEYSYWHLVIPYVLILLALPFNVLVWLKTWRGVKITQGDEKKILVERKKIFLIVQLFFSALFFVLFSGLTLLVLVLAFMYSSSYVDWEEVAVIGLPMIPSFLSLVTGLWYLIELMLLRRESVK